MKKKVNEITKCTEMVLRDSNLDYEILAEYNYSKWSPFIDLCIGLVHPKYGIFINLPFEGGLLDQPSRTMSILTVVKNVFMDYVEELNKN